MNADALILSFDTATNNCSIAVTAGEIPNGRVLGSVSFDSGVTHSRRLLGAIARLLRSLDLEIEDMAAVAVGVGPGSFTGLRIGMATAKGLCHGTGIPLIGISSLDALAASIVSDRLIAVVMDARKKEVYSCFYRTRSDGTISRCSEPTVLSPQELVKQMSEPVTMAGDGVHVYNDIFRSALGDTADIRAHNQWPDAVQVGYLAAAAFNRREYHDIHDAKPEYVRSSDAQLSLVSPLDREQ